MFCPKCGQQQVADNTRFCSRCGLAISGLAEWVTGSGVLAARAEAAPLALASPRRKGIRRGAKLMFLSGVLTPIFFGLCFLIDNPAPLFVPMTIFLAGLSLMLYARLFGENVSPAGSQPARPVELRAMFGSPALPPATDMGVHNMSGPQLRTAELAPPPSVTEHTTKLLERD